MTLHKTIEGETKKHELFSHAFTVVLNSNQERNWVFLNTRLAETGDHGGQATCGMKRNVNGCPWTEFKMSRYTLR
jgi:hypothetical protein